VVSKLRTLAPPCALQSLKRPLSKALRPSKSTFVSQPAHLLQGVISPNGTGALASLAQDPETPSPFQEAGKTGTSDHYQDGWFIGYLPGGLVTTVWFGNFVQPQIAQPEQNVYATSTNAAEAWGEYMRHCYEKWTCTTNPSAKTIVPGKTIEPEKTN
jgi:membrane peptidoglycan carboxypeptidase